MRRKGLPALDDLKCSLDDGYAEINRDERPCVPRSSYGRLRMARKAPSVNTVSVV